jgi:hypothetical protein
MKSRRTTFGQAWASMLWHVMQKSGHGYHRPTLRNSGTGADRRKDKLDWRGPQWARRYRDRFAVGGGA